MPAGTCKNIIITSEWEISQPDLGSYWQAHIQASINNHITTVELHISTADWKRTKRCLKRYYMCLRQLYTGDWKVLPLQYTGITCDALVALQHPIEEPMRLDSGRRADVRRMMHCWRIVCESLCRTEPLPTHRFAAVLFSASPP